MNHQSQWRPCVAMMRSVGRVFIMLATPGLALLALASCATPGSVELEGTATYRERIALPPDAVFEAVLQEVSQPARPGKVLGRALIDPAGQPPFHFKIGYDAAAIQPEGHYAVRATVKQQGRVLFTTGHDYPVHAGSNPPQEMLLVSANDPGPPAAIAHLPASYERDAPGANSLIRWHLDLLPGGHYQLRTIYLDKPEPNQFDQIGRWQYVRDGGRLTLNRRGEPPLYFAMEEDGNALHKLDVEGKPFESRFNDPLRRLPESALIEPRLALTGMFIYMADAASITLCDDGRRLPVAMESDYKALEAAYRQAGPQPGQALWVGLEGVIAARPSMEEGQPSRSTLIVERFKDLRPRETCEQTPADSSLRDTYWKLVRLNGEPVAAADRQREPHLIFAANDDRVSGSGGCNRVLGGFELDGDKLRLQQMAGTMMACMTGMDQEHRFLQALNTVERYRIHGNHLEMLDATGTVMAHFEAVTLR